VQNILRHKTFAFSVLIIWLLASWSGAHGHLCFDGQEPPISIHMDTLGNHPEHHQDEAHTDKDINLDQAAPTKLPKIDLPLLIAATLLLAMLFQNLRVFTSYYSCNYVRRRIGLRPPLRAPPVLPA